MMGISCQVKVFDLFLTIKQLLNKQVSIAPLVILRIAFGLLMFISTIRFAVNGWIRDFYISPTFYFKFYGFEFVTAPTLVWVVYLLYAFMGVAALFICLGTFYRISSIIFFLLFTYFELIDVTNYLNHYYLVSLISFLLIFAPAAHYFSIDVYWKRLKSITYIPYLYIFIFQIQIGIVYFYAGLAKLNYDWLIATMPLKIWLMAKSDVNVLGSLLAYPVTAYIFSWVGAAFDLFIVLFLIQKSTRNKAYIILVIFHLLTYWLFPIGMFPFVMMAITLVFLTPSFHNRVLSQLENWFNISSLNIANQTFKQKKFRYVTFLILGIYFSFQILFPLRYLLYDGNLYCTEQGYRFSWRVMLMEKTGNTTFRIHETTTNKTWEIENRKYLTALQEKMMSTQPDLILQFAHFLKNDLQTKGYQDIEVYADSYCTVNGHGSRLLIDPNVNLALETESFKHKSWVLDCE